VRWDGTAVRTKLLFVFQVGRAPPDSIVQRTNRSIQDIVRQLFSEIRGPLRFEYALGGNTRGEHPLSLPLCVRLPPWRLIPALSSALIGQTAPSERPLRQGLRYREGRERPKCRGRLRRREEEMAP
jgi:hypothetical protein